MNRADIQERLEMLPALYSTDGMKQREVQIVIYHMFSRWTWYVVEGEKLTITTHVFSTPAGDITVLTPEYEDEYEEMTPDFLMSSVVYENGEEVERHEN